MKWHAGGRMDVPSMVARAQATDAGIVLYAPSVGLWRGRPAPRALVAPGAAIGELEILGVCHRLLAPADAGGIVVDDAPDRRARIPVDVRTPLLTLDPTGSLATSSLAVTTRAAAASTGLVFRVPLSGRYYARPAPGEPPFVRVGDVVSEGQTVALLEVMKTFNRVSYGGEGLPARATVVAIRPADEADVDEDDVLLDLRPA